MLIADGMMLICDDVVEVTWRGPLYRGCEGDQGFQMSFTRNKYPLFLVQRSWQYPCQYLRILVRFS
jgi:hypothetical protein